MNDPPVPQLGLSPLHLAAYIGDKELLFVQVAVNKAVRALGAQERRQRCVA